MRLVILSDYGLDDAVATAYLMRHRDKYELIDVVAIAGNTSAKNSLNNANKLLDALGVESGNKKEYLKGVTLVQTLNVPQFDESLPSVHGNDGMGDLYQDVDLIKTMDFKEWLAHLKGEYVLFSAGPCTLTAEIQKAFEPKFTVIMAGVVNETPNFNGMEFNQALDVNAYNDCVKRKNTVVATLDSCRNKRFNLAGKRFLDGTVLSDLINRACELAEARHPDNCYIYDYIASLFLVQQKAFEVVNVVDKWGNSIPEMRLLGDIEF